MTGKSPKPRYIKPVEAIKLCIEMVDNGNSQDGIGWLPEKTVQDILGEVWNDRLGEIRIKDEERKHRNDRPNLIALDEFILNQIAISPVEPEEISLIVRNRFGGAKKALDFLKKNSHNRRAEVWVYESTVANNLGPTWEERVQGIPEATGNVSRLDYRKMDEEPPQVAFLARQLLPFIQAKLEAVVKTEVSLG